ncbi:rod-binding protein [Parerythrobacter lacustris]|uniref:Rod-binding protein n=1 Tax=Parerythrobacter lacustris TaxID=2969984 RepID=A0ABT1XQ64_9SPHN|nr:rod-binding protein [Parerythrobacter lacustris]MCR2832770.1 rod-binding protein [Parerythrobacter lacustris]
MSLAAQAADPREQLRSAAQAFEAIFLRQLLASARATDFGGEPLLGGPGLEQFEAMRDERFADIASQQGMFGLAEAIERQLAAFVGDTP